MKFKKEIIIISLIIAMFFTVSAVCAANSEVQAISAHNSTDTVVSTANDDNLKMNDANEILAETDDGSFAALNTTISGATAGSTVYLENDYEYSSSDNITSGIFIDKNLIIDGQGHKIDAKQKSRIFDCSPYAVVDVTLKNIIFLNGKADYGGALYWYPDGGESNIINCTFIGNSASGSYGGGATINEQDGISNIINCTFIDNHDTNCALYLSSTNVINSVFLNNGETTIYGQNIEADYNWFGNTIDNYNTVPSVTPSSALNNWYVLNMITNGANNVATLTLNNLYDRSEIKPCDTYELPSVNFNVEGTNATLNKDVVTLDSNGKASFGFTVTEDTGKLTASTNGVSLSKDVVNMADGGTMAALNTKITDAISNGESEVKLYNDYVYSDSEPIVTNTIYNGNSNNGIGIATDFTIDGQGYTIDGNNRGGRIIYFRDASKNLILKNINFVNCNDQYGSAVYVTCNSLEIINCTFTDGTATANHGAGIYASVYGNYNIKTSNFTNNKITASNKNGGAIALFTNSGTTGEIVNCSFMNNQVNNYGGALYITSNGGVGGDTGSISGCIFKGNVASMGSSLYLYSPGSYTLTNSILLDEGNIIFSKNAFNIDNNWWGSTVDDYSTLQVNAIYGNQYNNIPVNKWLYLDVVVDNENTLATVSLNNLNDGTVYENYELPEITLNIQATNANININNITLDENGQATANYEMTDKTGTLTVSYENVEITKEIKLFVQDSFTSLKNQIDDSEESTIYLNQNYTYSSRFDDGLTKGIEITKSITVDGNGYAIDAKGLSNIVYFNDDTNTKNLILKNIVFTNATGNNGAAVYFKGNKIEIINCTFINNNANSQGDAVYIVDAASSESRITESRFMNNTGENSVAYINLDSSNAKLNLSNSIILSNDAVYDIKGTSNVIVDYNWWGNVDEDKTNSPKSDGATVNNWFVLKISADTDTNIATVNLNNLYDGNGIGVYENYALPSISVNIKGTNINIQKSTVTLDDSGKATTSFTLLKPDATLTASYENLETTDEIHYVPVDDGSFKALNDIISFSSENDVIELTQNYTYFDTDTIAPGIQITKTITIDGNGNTIDAKGKSGIFLINSPNVIFKNIIFKNGIFENGGAIYASQNADYLTVVNCTFINNTATNTDGGAIWSGSYYFGSVVNSTFINNTAVKDGAAIFTYSFYIDAEIGSCLFINNSAPNTVIYAYYMYNCHNSIFLNNTGNKIIDGTYANYGTVGTNWYGNTFDDYDNRIVQMGVSSYKWLYLNIKFYEDYAVVSLNNLYAPSSGSSSIYSNYNLPEITLNINSTTLDLKNKDKITLDSTGKSIVPYEMISETGALTVSYGDISLTKDRVTSEFDLIQTLIDNAEQNSVIELYRDYTYNDADETTKGILINKNITIDGKGHTIDAKQMTRIFNVQATDITFKNIIFANGKSNLRYEDGNHGGAIYFNLDNNEAVNFNLINCTFVNNVADVDNYNLKYSGGAVFIKSNEGSYNITDCTFSSNTAKDKGGAIYFNTKNAEINLYNSTFIGNKAEHDGALYIETDRTDITIDKCLFRKNEAILTSSYSSNGNAIIWKSTNDTGNSVLKNSIILDNAYDKTNKYVFLLISGTVNIDDNWWGTTAQNHPENLGNFIINGITPNSWLFIKADVSDDQLSFNETATIKYVLYSHDGTQISEFDNTKLPYAEFNVESDKGTLDKNNVSLNEEFTYHATEPGNSLISIYCNNIPYETTIYGPYMIPKVDIPFTIYANQNNINKNKFIETANGYYSGVTVTCNDSSLLKIEDPYISAHTNEGTALLTFHYSGSSSYAAEDLEMVVKVVKVPLTINVTNIESKEITLNVGDTLDLDIAFEIDAIHKDYAPAWDVLGFECNSNITQFTYDNGIRPDNGSYYPTGHIKAKAGGTTDLTIYSTSKKFTFENYTIKITVNKILTEITVDGEDSFKVDDTHNINAKFYVGGTQATSALIYESSDEDVIKFISDDGQFKAMGEGTAVLTVRFAGNSTHESSSKTLTVTVSKWSSNIDLISQDDVALNVFANSQIEASLNPSQAGSLSYKSSNESVATVDDNGLITAHAGGKTNITISFAGDNKYAPADNVNVSVTVNKLPTTITVNPTVDVDVGASKSLGATVDNGRTLQYVSLNPDIVSVDDSGIITGIIGGTGIINISFAEDGQYLAKSTTVTVTVNKLDSTIAVSPIEINVFENKLINPDVVSDGAVSYVSCDPTIVTVNPTTGNIAGVKGGKANITVKVAESDKYLAKEVNVTVTVNKLPTTITVNPTIGVDVDGTNTIQASANHGRTLHYISLNPEIVTVDEGTGVITGIIGGEAKITVKFTEDDQYLGKEVDVTVTVNKLTPAVNVNPIEISVFESKLINPDVVSDGDVSYVSCNSSIVTVDGGTGEVTGVIGGKANVTIRISETPRYFTKEVNVTVTVNKLPTIITVNPTMRLKIGENANIIASVESGADIHYQTDSEIITVDENGLVTALNGGVAQISVSVDATEVYAANSVFVTVTVARLPDDLTPISIYALSTVDVSELYILGGDESNLKYSSSNETVFTVSEKGNLTSLAGGQAYLTITDENLGESVSVNIIVNKLPTKITVNPTIDVKVYESKSLGATADNGRSLHYESLNPEIVTVSQDGIIAGVIGGTATISISYIEDGQYLANSTTVFVTVKKLPAEISVNESEFSMFVDEKVNINATASSDSELLYASNSPHISVSNGLVTGVSNGTAYVKIIALETDHYLAGSEIVKITVNKISSKIDVENDNISINVGDNVDVGANLNHDGDLTYKYDESVIKIENGSIIALIGGKTNITVSYAGNYKYLPASDVNITVNVKKLTPTITVNPTVDVDVDASESLGATVDNARTLKYVSLNPDIVSVDDSGIITGIIGGTGIINISFAEDGQYLAKSTTVTVTVNKLDSTIAVNPIEINVFENKLINPDVSSDRAVSYVSCDPTIVTVNPATGNIAGIKGGKANITVKVAESDKYLAKEVTVTVTVNKLPTTIAVNSTIGVDVDGTNTIQASANHGRTLHYISLNPEIVTVDEGTGVITGIIGGEAKITVKFTEDDQYLGKEVDVTVTVNKLPVKISVEKSNDVFVGGTSTIKLNVNQTNGNVIVNVNGTEYLIDTSKTKELSVVLDKEGKYEVFANYIENDKVLSNKSNTIFITSSPKQNNNIAIDITQDIKVGDKVQINATSGSGLLDVYLDGIKQDSNRITKYGLAAGTHTVEVKCSETSEFKANSTVKTFEISKKESDIKITVDKQNIQINQEAEITINQNGRTGAIVYIDGKQYYLDNDGLVQGFIVTAGNHTIFASLGGTDEYLPVSANYTFDVSKKAGKISIDTSIQKAYVGDKAIVYIEVSPDATGFVVVNANGATYSITLPKNNVEIVLDKAGKYNINATYLGDDAFTVAESNVKTIDVVEKSNSNINIEISPDIKSGEVVEITVTSDSRAKLDVLIDGEKYTPVNGKVIIEGLSAGKHTIEVISPETSNYKANYTSKSINVNKKQSNIEISHDGELIVDSYIKINVDYVGSNVVVYFDGNVLSNYNVPFKATAGKHLVMANVAEDDQYFASSANYTFDVAKKESTVSVSASAAIVGGTSTIDVGLTNGATGMVIVNVNGTEYSINISQSKYLSIVLNNPGEYDINAKYLGDDKFLPSESEANSLVVEDKKDNSISIYPQTNIYAGDDIEIEVISANDIGLNVYFDGIKQTVKEDKFIIKNIASGNHLIEVVSLETSEFKSNSVSKTIKIDKKHPNVNIALPKTIAIGSDVPIEISSDSDSEIIVYIDGVKQTLTNGKMNIKATAGEHTVTVNVAENDNYLASSANKTFTVNKLNAQIAISGVDITEGQTTTITIDTAVNEGLVVASVGNIQLIIDLAIAKSAKVKLETPGTYDLTANYLGTDIYKPSVAKKSIIKVQSKPAAKVDITIPDIKAGESKPISISILNATGDVHVIVDGVDNVVTLDKDGKASYPLDNIPAGEHNVVVVYDDGVNDPAISSKSFNVSKQTAKAEITTPANVKEGENATVKVNIPGATGEVSVFVDGNEEKIALVNGAAEYQLNNVSGGEHSVVVIYPGDETHDSAYSASSFDVAKKPAVVKKASEFSDITIDDDLMISFILKDEDGNPIRDAVIKYNDGTEKTVKTDYHGQFRIQAVNNALISITYEGNAAITGTGTAFKLNVPAAPVSQKVETHFNIPDRSLTLTGYAVDSIAGEEGIYYSTTLLDANGKPVSNAYMEFAVNNKIYNRTTDAKGSFTPYKLNMIRAGRYTMAFNFAGNENYTNTFACVCVDLDKKPITIKAASKTFKASVKTKKYTVSLSTIVGSSHDGKIYLKSGKPVTLTVNGKKYTAQTNSKNKATFKITGLSKKGTYDATIYFKGDKTYVEKEKTVKLTIS